MQPTYTEIKKAAKSSLKHRWPEAIAVSVFLMVTALLDTVMQSVLMSIFKVGTVWSPILPSDVPYYNIIASIGITIFSAVYSLFIKYPLLFGVIRWFWSVTGGGNPSIAEIFYYFSNGKLFFKTIAVSFGVLWRTFLGAIVCFIPLFVFIKLTTPDIYNALGYSMPPWLDGLYPLANTVEVICFIAFLMWMTIFALFYAVIIVEPGLSVHKTYKRAALLSKGQRWHFACFVLSFLGWALLCLLILPIIFVVPFLFASLTIYGRESYRYKTNRQQQQQNQPF